MKKKNTHCIIYSWVQKISFGASVAFLICACGGSRENDPIIVSQPSLDKTVQETVDTRIIPAAENFADRNKTLTDAIGSFCGAPTASQLEALQAQWRQLTTAWYRLLPYNFGPLNDDVVFPTFIYIDSLRLRGTNYLATVREEIAKDLASDVELNTSYFAGKSFQRVGLLALEVALFERGEDGNMGTEQILAEYTSQPRKCQIIQGLASQLQSKADAIVYGWNVNYKNSGQAYREIFLSGQLSDGSDPVSVLLTSVQEFLDYLKQRHVVDTAAQLSANAWPMMASATQEIDSMLNGNTSTRFTFFALMKANGYDMSVETVQENLGAARSSIISQDASLFEVAVSQLDGNFKREIPDGLDVDLGITFTDGD